MFTKLCEEIKNKDKKVVFILEDDEMYANALQNFLQNHFDSIKEVRKFRTDQMCLLELRHEPSIIIMGYPVNCPYIKVNNDLETIKRIKMLKPQINIIVLGIPEKHKSSITIVKENGCSYVLKDQQAFKKIASLINIFFMAHKTVFMLN